MSGADELVFEVEMKFPVLDQAGVERKLCDLGGIPEGRLTQVDCYFSHPSRNFAVTDEAFRLRTIDQENRLTYKGPRLDQTTKTRAEIEVSIGSGPETARQMELLLACLGFARVAQVRKVRRVIRLTWQDWPVEAALDHVERVGEFLELEVQADADQLAEAQRTLLELARQLQLPDSERRSYLELLLASQAGEQTRMLDS
jgi:adenylate cyclase, class 2